MILLYVQQLNYLVPLTANIEFGKYFYRPQMKFGAR